MKGVARMGVAGLGVLGLGGDVAIVTRRGDRLGRLDRGDRTGSGAQPRLEPQEDRGGQADSQNCGAPLHAETRLGVCVLERQLPGISGFLCELRDPIAEGIGRLPGRLELSARCEAC